MIPLVANERPPPIASMSLRFAPSAAERLRAAGVISVHAGSGSTRVRQVGRDSSATTGIVRRGVTKKFGAQKVVREVYLDIEKGEFFTMLGPSGAF